MLTEFLPQLMKDSHFDERALIHSNEGFTLFLDPDLEIYLSENPNSGITLMAHLAELPKSNREDFLRNVLSANLFGKETGGNVLGVDQEEKQLLLTRQLPPKTSYKEFYHSVEEFANYAEAWRVEATSAQKT